MSEHNLRRAAERMAEAIRQAKTDIGFVACDNACDDAPCELLRALVDWDHQVALPPAPYIEPAGPICTQEDIDWVHQEIARRKEEASRSPRAGGGAAGGQES